MPAVKVKSSGSAPTIVQATTIDTAIPLVYEPDLVRVRATRRGYYGVRMVNIDPMSRARSIVRNEIIRNEAEVFDYDTADMRKWPLGAARLSTKDAPKKEHPHDGPLVVIETARGQFELPSWLELADESGVEETASAGHKTTFGKKEGEVL